MADLLHTDRHLADLVAFVRREADPVRIVLFGSRARDAARPDSDYDLLVVVADGQEPRAVARRLYARKRGIPVASDFLVQTESRHARAPHSAFERTVARGRVVYERPDG